MALAACLAWQPAFGQEQQPADPEDEQSDENVIIVEGFRGAIESALDQEREADGLVSIVTADDIGQFGDPTVAESLQRISGVSINRENGEGQQVSIRGLPTEFATVTIDGTRLGTSDSNINSTNLDFFSADNLSQIEVNKTLTPEQDADAIAGSVNLQSTTAFRRGRDAISLRAEMGYQDRNEAFNPAISGDITRIFDVGSDSRIGIAAGFAWSDRDTFTDQTEVGDGLFFLVNEGSLEDPEYDDADDCTDEDTVECFLRPREFDLRVDERSRERLSLNGALEFETGRTLLRLIGNYSTVDTLRINDRQTFALDRSNRDREIDDLGTFSGNITDARSERRIRPQNIDDEVFTIAFEGETGFGTDWTLFYGGDYSSNSRVSDQTEGRFRADDIRLIYENLSAEGVDVVLEQEDDDEADPNDPFDWELNNDQINQRFEDSQDEFVTLYADLQRDFALFGRDADIKVGVQNRSRERDFDFDRFEYLVDDAPSLGDFVISDSPDFTRLDISYGVDRDRLFTALDQLVAGGTLLGPEDLGNGVILNSIASDYTAEEDTLAGYLQLTFEPFDNVQVIGGFRVERSEFSSTGSRVRDVEFSAEATDVLEDALDDGGVAQATIDAFVAGRSAFVSVDPFSGENSYTEFFPSLNIRWEPTDTLVVRASYTEGLKRPEFREAAAILQFRAREQGLDEDTLQDIIDDDFGGSLASIAEAEAAIAAAVAEDGDPRFENDAPEVRDPTLDPLTSRNYDASISWYPSRNTALSVAFFYKEISNFIFPVGISGDDVIDFGFEPDSGTLEGGGVSRFTTFINGDDASIYGVELNYYQAFTFLPGPLSGLFMQANATIAESEASAPFVDRTFAFPDQSDLIGNLSVGWENDVFSFRAAGVYQGDRLRGLNQAQLDDSNDPAGDILEEERFQLDFSARYEVLEDVQIYFDAINVLEAEDNRFFRGDPSLNGPIFQALEDYGATYQIGVRARF
ncbi:TonB-dependent receptor [Aurantiacibacter gangjinensis]|uniref:TonB-dependent receptor n=1 Tax=Aurantiacibacter gangjinensis TaxID=502682 RepID=A0A0G9MRK5_9SPHN|nr:TonB-dependent receptor [Aurantiacibacter gangjinensis]KLE33362.1 hypothetical protein AAW01_05345 [Aurantiacibacter gangjinensis]